MLPERFLIFTMVNGNDKSRAQHTFKVFKPKLSSKEAQRNIDKKEIMELKIIKTKKEYLIALQRFEEIFSSKIELRKAMKRMFYH